MKIIEFLVGCKLHFGPKSEFGPQQAQIHAHSPTPVHDTCSMKCHRGNHGRVRAPPLPTHVLPLPAPSRANAEHPTPLRRSLFASCSPSPLPCSPPCSRAPRTWPGHHGLCQASLPLPSHADRVVAVPAWPPQRWQVLPPYAGHPALDASTCQRGQATSVHHA